MAQAMHKGSCLCGKVAFEVELDNKEVHICHCENCQKWAGGPGLSVKCGSDWHIHGEENVRWFDSSEWAQRAFCRECGSHLFFRLKDGSYHAVVPQTLDNTDGFDVHMHIFIDKKPPYYDFTDQSKRLTGKEFYQMVGAAE